MNKINVAVLYGGCSPEHDISRISANNIISNLSTEKYNVIPVYINEEGSWYMYDYKNDLRDMQWERVASNVLLSSDRSYNGLIRLVREKAKRIPIDIIFPVLHGMNGEDGTIQGLFEISNVPYVGCGVLSSSISMDKSYTNMVASSIGIEQTEYLVFRDYEFKNETAEIIKRVGDELGYPCFVKPCNAGSSIGVFKVNHEKDLEDYIRAAFQYDNKIIVEKFVKCRELECAILGLAEDNEVYASTIGEIKSAKDFYDYNSKYVDGETELSIPADIPKEISDEIKEKAIKIFKAVDGSGLSRLDFFIEEGTNRVLFNEINTMPGFTSVSMYPLLWKEDGLEFDKLLDKLISIGLKKFENKENRVWTKGL